MDLLAEKKTHTAVNNIGDRQTAKKKAAKRQRAGRKRPLTSDAVLAAKRDNGGVTKRGPKITIRASKSGSLATFGGVGVRKVATKIMGHENVVNLSRLEVHHGLQVHTPGFYREMFNFQERIADTLEDKEWAGERGYWRVVADLVDCLAAVPFYKNLSVFDRISSLIRQVIRLIVSANEGDKTDGALAYRHQDTMDEAYWNKVAEKYKAQLKIRCDALSGRLLYLLISCLVADRREFKAMAELHETPGLDRTQGQFYCHPRVQAYFEEQCQKVNSTGLKFKERKLIQLIDRWIYFIERGTGYALDDQLIANFSLSG